MADTNPLVTIVAYQNTADLESALRSLGAGHALLVVDNGADDEVRALVDEYGGRYMTSGHNIGFAAAVNVALAERDGRDVLLLNPDARVSPDLPQALAALLQADPRLAAVAPRLEDQHGESQRVEWPIPSPREAWIDAVKLRRLFPPQRVFFVGAVLLLRADALADVGPFDERFFLYAEECDWQFRAVQRGWQLKLAENLVAVHAGGGSSSEASSRDELFHRSAALFGKKWYGRRGWASMHLAFALGNTLRLLLSVARPAERARYARQMRL